MVRPQVSRPHPVRCDQYVWETRLQRNDFHFHGGFLSFCLSILAPLLVQVVLSFVGCLFEGFYNNVFSSLLCFSDLI